jgi:hypothetical protein
VRSTDRTWFDLADESIAAAWQGLDIARLVGGVTQFVTQPLHGRVEAVLEIYERIVRPQALAKLVTPLACSSPVRGSSSQGPNRTRPAGSDR